MTVKELRTLIENLDEYIRIPGGIEKLRKTILHLAASGQLVSQVLSDGTGEELYDQIKAERSSLIKKGKIKRQNENQPPIADEYPYEIPGSWKWVRLGSMLTIERGGSPRPIKEFLTEDESGYNWIKIGDTNPKEKYITATKEKIVKEGLKKTRQVFPGDLLLSNSMSFGKPFIMKISGCIHDGWLVFRDESKLVNPDYLYYIFLSPSSKRQFNEAAAGAVVQNLNSEKVRELIVPLPPAEEQIKIVRKLEECYKLLDELEILYAQEERARNILTLSLLSRLQSGNDLAFVHFTEIIKSEDDVKRLENAVLSLAVRGQLVPQIPVEGSSKELYDQIQAEKAKLIREGKFKKQKELPPVRANEVPFEIPNSWRWTRLADITNFTIGRTPKRVESKYWDEEYMPWVSIADLNDQGYVDETKEKISKIAFDEVFRAAHAPAGSLLYSFKLTIGKMSILSVDAVHNEAIASLAVYSKITRDYLFKALKALDPTTRTNAAIKGMTLNSGTLSLLEVPLPPLKEQERIIQKIDQIFELTKELRVKIKN